MVSGKPLTGDVLSTWSGRELIEIWIEIQQFSHKINWFSSAVFKLSAILSQQICDTSAVSL